MKMKPGSELIGKNVLVVFEDGRDHYSKKEGVCSSIDNIGIMINKKDFLLHNKIIRIEVRKDGTK